ncbi:HMG domain-containing protein 3 isoform X2 [Sardina pilchardus]|uniref:HMG domain-containing protein 3 isoform X2 n=1 Tax=Sardina pilchardus TaxID=27697 RepID=UPI002E0D59CE
MEAVFEDSEVRLVEEVESCYSSLEVPSPKRRRKPKGHAERLDKTKKPRSAYLLYYFDVHQRLQQEHPDLPQSEINKRISESWRRLSVADKAFYLDRALLERDGLTQRAVSAVASQDVPGFRRILPRASFVLLPKGGVLDEQAGGAVEVCVDDGGGGGGVCGESPLFSPMALGSEVELAEQSVAMEMPRDDTAAANASVAVATLPQPHALTHTLTSCPVKEQEATPTTAVGMVMEEGLLKTDSTHLVAIIPNQNLLESKVMTPASSVLMLPLMSSVDAAPTPAVKLSIKYTRRGRGSCHTPGCPFTYVTRHKPPLCPLCGLHLGGKWIAVGKKDSDKAGALPSNDKPSPWTPQKDTPPPSAPHSQEAEPGAGLSAHQNSAANAKQRQTIVRLPRERRAPTQPPEGAGAEGTESVEGAEQNATSATAAITATRHSTATEGRGRRASSGRSRGRARSVGTGQKRPVRAILPAPTKAVPSPATVVQFITVPSSNKPKVEVKNSSTIKTVKVPCEISGLKPSTLKQLGHTLPSPTPEQKPASRLTGGQFIITENSLKMLSMVPFKQNTGANLDLGLSTARGRGRCKNPGCDYVYKNRHKPAHCPACGWELSKNPARKSKAMAAEDCRGDAECVLDPYTPLTAAQRDVQRQNTLQLLRQCLQIPESEGELQDTLTLIQELNNTQVVVSSTDEQLSAQLQSSWPRFYESPAEHCSLCQFPLFKGGQSSVAGQEDCWLLTESHLQTASIQLKICTNTQCLALHSLIDIHPGLFNVGNKLLVSLDLFFKIRNHLRLGHDPAQAAVAILQNVQNQPVSTLSGSELSELVSLVLAGYWAFESLTLRDYNDMICGVCGVAPRVEMAQRNSNNTLLLRNVEFTWPEYAVSDEVQVDDFWLTMENEALEQAAFPSSPPITRFDASIIAPFIPPLMRAAAVINTEKDKSNTHTPAGDTSTLVRLIHEGLLKPEQMHEHTPEELQSVLERCGAPTTSNSTQEELLESVCSLYTHIQSGQLTGPPPPSHLTAGRLSKVCPHQVVCGSKYLVHNESVRDHVDLLVCV